MTRHSRHGQYGRQTTGQLALPLVPALTRRLRCDLARRIETDWQDRAACAGTADPDAFYPDDLGSVDAGPAVARLVDPARMCADCPVTRSCLIAALLGDEQGIWGRTTEPERDEITRQLVAAGNVGDLFDTTVHTVGSAAVVQPGSLLEVAS